MNDDELRDLAERTQQIRDMAETGGWAMLCDRVLAEVSMHQKRILGGRLSEEEYRREAGFVEGAMSALQMPDRVLTEYLRVRERFEAEQEEAA